MGAAMENHTRPAAVVVDDEPPIVAVVCEALEDAGIRTVGCEPGHEAHACIRCKQPKVVILDIQMPEVDGVQVFQQLRTDPATTAIPVIFLTANAHILKQRLPNYQEMGAELLPKPFRIERLIALVERALSA